MGVHPDTVTDYVRAGMPTIARGGYGKTGSYDAVACLDWWRSRQGKNAKEAAQAELYRNNATLAELKIQQAHGQLLSREDVVRDGQAIVKGWTAMVRAIPRQARHAGVIHSSEQEVGLAGICRALLLEVSSWKSVAGIARSTKAVGA